MEYKKLISIIFYYYDFQRFLKIEVQEEDLNRCKLLMQKELIAD